jgi:methylmalonyl-CoA mutase
MAASAKDEGVYVPVHPVRFVTSTALFDGHDAAINITRRILQSQGAEVVHLGHDRSVHEVVDAVLEEDAQGVAVSSYQGGHVEYFEYLAKSLEQAGAGHVKIFGGGGGVIVPEEIARLAGAGVRIFSPEDGQRLGLAGMINELIRACDTDLAARPPSADVVLAGERRALARAITCLQAGRLPDSEQQALVTAAGDRRVPVLGITGTGGSGKSSLTDELVRRLRTDQQDKLRVAVLAVDPTRRRGGGALLGDRIRMNALDGDRVFFRSLATRGARELPDNIEAIIAACNAAGCSPGMACRWPTACFCGLPAGPRRTRPRSSRRRGRAIWRRSPRPSAATTSRRRGRPRRCGGCSGSPPCGRRFSEIPNGPWHLS